MTLQSSGSIAASHINAELGRTAGSPVSLDGAQERALAGIESGAISYSSFYGRAAEVVRTIAAGEFSTLDRMDMYFSPEDWAADIPKRLIVPAGLEIGSKSRNYAIAVALTAGGQEGSFGGTLTLEVNGTITGKGGAASSYAQYPNAGGNAVYANLPGRDGQPLHIVVNPGGVIRGGGGSGGHGGQGGDGSYSGTVREPSSGYTFNASTHYFMSKSQFNAPFMERENDIEWNNVFVLNQSLSAGNTELTQYEGGGGWTYYRGTLQSDFKYSLYRQRTATISSTGGYGGAGGAGAGYQQARAYGSAGSNGTHSSAGKGGTGGRGGDYGGSGATGATGAAGNLYAGSPGYSGGAGGAAITNPENFTLTNNGTILGAYT